MIEQDNGGDAPSAIMTRRAMLGVGAGALASAGTLAQALIATPAAAAESAGTGATAATATATGALPWPPVAHFGSKPIVGPHQSAAATMLDERDLLGLPRQSAFIYGNLRDADGNMSEWVRNFKFDGVGKQGLFVQSSAGKDTLRILPEVFMAAATDYVAGMENGEGVWKSPADAKGKPFRLTMAADGSKIHWVEQDSLDITGTLMGPGLQWHIPHPDGSELYVSQIYEFQGTALGKPVKGILAFDKVHLPNGQQLYGGQDPLFRPKEHHRTWYTWGTRYTDGSFDAGHFVLGTDRIGFALLTNERGELTLDTDVTGQVDLISGDIWPKGITVKTSKGVTWEFLPDPKGRMPDMLHSTETVAFTPQTEGRWRRAGDRRTPAVWFAWGEVAPLGRTDYRRNYRF